MQKGAPVFTMAPDLSPLEQEGVVLKFFKDNFTPKIKNLKKMAFALHHNPDVPIHAKRGIVNSVLVAKDPAKFLKEAFKEINDIPVIMQGLRDDGNHGMIMLDSDIYGFEIQVRPGCTWLREDDTWNPDDEREIIDASVEAFMEKHLLKRLDGKILLFKEFGFSGMPLMVRQEFTQEYYDSLILGLAREA